MQATHVEEPVPHEIFTNREAARYLRISERQLYSLRVQGEIPYAVVGRSIRFRLADLRLFLSQQIAVGPGKSL